MSKLVSVVVPNYNCAPYLDKCLEHIVNQTYTNFECIVCDNASTDNSLEIINSWAKKDKRIKVLTTEVNVGGMLCYNRMFFEAKGDYIMIQDSDDWCDLQRIEKQVAVLDKYNVGCCMTNSVFYYAHTEPEYPDRPGSGVVNIEQEDWAPATIMFKREILNEIPGYHLYWDRVTSYDNYFIMDIISKYGGYYLDDYLYFVWARHDSDHRSIDLTDKAGLRKLISFDVYKFLKKQRIETGTDWLKEGNMEALNSYEQQLMNDKNYLADKIRMFACIQIDNGKYKNGWSLLKQAISTSPGFIKNYQSLLYLLRSRIKTSA
jgi:glycosyltransferase involved in cell wall biosynthesis